MYLLSWLRFLKLLISSISLRISEFEQSVIFSYVYILCIVSIQPS